MREIFFVKVSSLFSGKEFCQISFPCANQHSKLFVRLSRSTCLGDSHWGAGFDERYCFNTEGGKLVSYNGKFVGSADWRFICSADCEFVGSADGEFRGFDNKKFIGSADWDIAYSTNGEIIGSTCGDFVGSIKGELIGMTKE